MRSWWTSLGLLAATQARSTLFRRQTEGIGTRSLLALSKPAVQMNGVILRGIPRGTAPCQAPLAKKIGANLYQETLCDLKSTGPPVGGELALLRPTLRPQPRSPPRSSVKVAFLTAPRRSHAVAKT